MEVKKEKVLEATATNAFFIATGLAMYSVSLSLIPTALWAVALGIGSGYHHWNIGREWIPVSKSRLFDYFPMYGILLSMILLATGTLGWMNIALSLAGALILIFSVKSSRIALGVLIALVLILLVWVGGFRTLMETAPMLAVAWGFNYLGDQVVDHKHHSMVHSIWHIVICSPIYEASSIFIKMLL